MTAFDHFQEATVLIASGCLIAAQQNLQAAIRWIDRTGKDASLRPDLVALLDQISTGGRQ